MNRLLKVGPASQSHTGYPARATANERPSKGRASRKKPKVGAVETAAALYQAGRPVTSTQDPRRHLEGVAFFTSECIFSGASDPVARAGCGLERSSGSCVAFPEVCNAAFTSTPQTKTCLWGPRIGRSHLAVAASSYSYWRTARAANQASHPSPLTPLASSEAKL
jgi:hypothetical protein